ncbi:hypothetical protein K438DRAFT_1855850 [Mycena galopus ATCC 62051]|nr:hypothetical protein K438DRAFT_1855850 [Mycena galopus ATCC 62051]
MSTTPKRPKQLKQSPAQFSTRKKSCLQCSEAKARCSLQRPVCSRCQGRDLQCQWFTVNLPDTVTVGSSSPASACESLDGPRPAVVEDLSYPTSPPTLESVRIGSRWMDALVPPEGRIAKILSPQTVQFMSRVLKSYPKIILNELPPVVHPFQSAVPQQLLVNCRTLLRMWENKAPGSELLVRETIRREMNRIFEEHPSYDHITLLSACQAYLLYSIHLFFCADADARAMINTTTMINLQELASSMSLTGLYSPDAGPPPADWDSWILGEAKRRTLYTMYIFDHVFNDAQNATSYVGTELGHLALPSSKALWAAATQDDWKAEYERFVAEWPSEAPRLENLWPETEVIMEERRERADRWIGSADEFGMFIFAVSSMIFG